MRPRIEVVAAAATAPLTLARAKAHLRVSGTREDDEIEGYIAAATAQVEEEIGRSLIVRTYRAHFPGFPDGSLLQLPRPPIVAAGMAVDLISDAGSATSWMPLMSWRAIAGDGGGVQLRRGKAWPAVDTLDPVWPVRVSFKAGYGDPEPVDDETDEEAAARARAAIPDHVLQLLRLTVSEMYHNRAGESAYSLARRRLVRLSRPIRGGRAL